jgi:hypothetical protein
MKKFVLAFLIFLGAIFGWWMARENRKLFELPVPVEHRQEDTQQGAIDTGRIAIGMETWQVKQALGVPEKRDVVVATKERRKEQWIYGKQCLYFTNGVLTSWQELTTNDPSNSAGTTNNEQRATSNEQRLTQFPGDRSL